MITKQILSALPIGFGIYQYLDDSGHILYIGKAKNLKKRISSYFRFDDNTPIPNPANSQRIQLMISQARHIRTIVVESEQDALLLENSLIKQLKPKYNILLRDDKTYPYISINMAADFPRFEMTRRVEKLPHFKYFGPYPSGCRDILDSLYDLFALVQKSSCMKGKKACLFHQIQKCRAPCEGKISQEEYIKITRLALDFLQNKNKLLKALEAKMHECAQKELFEKAQIYKERINKIAPLANFSQITSSKPYNFDILYALKFPQKQNHKIILLKIFMREGRLTSSSSDILHHHFEASDEEIFKQCIINHYQSPTPLPPDEILLPAPLDDRKILESFLQQTQGQKIAITSPQRGLKKKLLEMAKKNAEEILRQNLHENTAKDALLEHMRDLLHLWRIPFRIEVFDTSHHSFSYNVGAMVVYENHHFISSAYRRYNLQSRDEYSQMREMLLSRIKSFEKNPPPDLWLLDGGKGQIQIAKELLDSFGIKLDVIGIAKEKLNHKAHRAKGLVQDRVYYFHQTLGMQTLHLSPSDLRLQLLQKLRDEAHRFAITFHRKQKTRSLTKALPYTPAQTKKLLDFFGDFKAIQQASAQEIDAVIKNRFTILK